MNVQARNHNYSSPPIERRKFIFDAGLAATGMLTLASLPGVLNAEAGSKKPKSYTVQEIINTLIQPVDGAPFKQTVDTLKSGSPDQNVTGVVTTMFATLGVIRQAVRSGANFIIAHEPSFYNHTDDKNWSGLNHVVTQKEEMLKNNGVAIWRFHDYWHSYKPDGIKTGVLQALGWEKYFKPEEEIVDLPETNLKKLVEHLKSSLGIKQVRVIGNANHSCRKVAIMPGAAGGQRQIAAIEKLRPDVFICGEVHEWETGEYLRDAWQSEAKTALVILGHSQSEEPGMKWLAKQMQTQFMGLTITHIPSGDPFIWI